MASKQFGVSGACFKTRQEHITESIIKLSIGFFGMSTAEAQTTRVSFPARSEPFQSGFQDWIVSEFAATSRKKFNARTDYGLDVHPPKLIVWAPIGSIWEKDGLSWRFRVPMWEMQNGGFIRGRGLLLKPMLNGSMADRFGCSNFHVQQKRH